MSNKIEYYYTCHIGKCRKLNQDNFFCDVDYLSYENNGTEEFKKGNKKVVSPSVFAVLDGMGGEEKGEMAAYIGAKTLSSFEFKKDISSSCIEYCKIANNEICKYAEENNICSMGSTVAMLVFSKKQITMCNVGDSKVFLFSDKKLEQISFDHVAVSSFGRKPPLSQNLGIPEKEILISPYISVGKYNKGDAYLICSDGLTDMVSVSEIEQILLKNKREKAIKALLEKALENGGRDNITIVLIYVKKGFSIF